MEQEQANTTMTGKIQYKFTAKIWQHTSPGGWFFVSLPNEMAGEIRMALKSQEEGWGRLKAAAQVGESTWETAIWYDSKYKTYLLPLKGEIRKKEQLSTSTEIEVTLWL